jgi:Flp pilus assembly protein TadD
VAGDVDKPGSGDGIGDVVAFETSADFNAKPPLCLAVMPLSLAKPEFGPAEDVRKAIHAHLAPSGIALVPLQKIDALIDKSRDEAQNLHAVSKGSGCDTLLTGELTERSSRFWGVYSDVRLGASLRMTRVSTGQVIWRGKHTAVVRGGGMPMDVISAIGGVVAAGANVREEQLTRTTHDVARRLVAAIPNLKYAPDSDLVTTAAATVPTSGGAALSVHTFISSVEQHPLPQLEGELLEALDGPTWTGPQDRIVIADFLLQKAPRSSRAMQEIASARLRLGEPDSALAIGTKALTIAPQNPELHFLQGRAYLQLDRPAEAARAFVQAAAAAPQPSANYFTAMGVAYNQLGSYERAVAALGRSLQLEPGRPFVHMQIGVAYVGAGDDALAAQALRQSAVLSLAASDAGAAANALRTLKAMGLEGQLPTEDLQALEELIATLKPT